MTDQRDPWMAAGLARLRGRCRGASGSDGFGTCGPSGLGGGGAQDRCDGSEVADGSVHRFIRLSRPRRCVVRDARLSGLPEHGTGARLHGSRTPLAVRVVWPMLASRARLLETGRCVVVSRVRDPAEVGVHRRVCRALPSLPGRGGHRPRSPVIAFSHLRRGPAQRRQPGRMGWSRATFPGSGASLFGDGRGVDGPGE
jgi:hypothetical protein